MQHHGADQILKQGDLLRLQAAGSEEGFRRFNEVDLFRILNVLLQRLKTKLDAARQHLDILFAVEAHRPAQQRLGFAAGGGNVMVAVEPLADRFPRRRAEH